MGRVNHALIQAVFGGALAIAAPLVSAQERVRFPSLDSDLTKGAPTDLEGYLFRPAGEGPFPAVVALHGCGGLFSANSARLHARHRDWAERLTSLGYVVLFPDSLNPRGVADLCTRNDPPIRPGVHRVRDAYGALAYLIKQSFVTADRVAALGWSHGGSTALWVAGRPAEPRRKDLPGGFQIAVAFYPGCVDANRRQWRAAISVHILSGEADDWTPASACQALAERARKAGDPVEFVAYPGAPHGFDAPNQAKMTRQGVFTPSGTATVGTDPEARADAIRRVPEILARALKPGP